MIEDSGMIEPPNELMERAKLRAKAKGLKTGFPLTATEVKERGPFTYTGKNEVDPGVLGNCASPYPYYGNKETCPPWYKRWAIDPITFCMINGVTGDILNIIKYIMRFDMKDGLKDLYKARDYLNMMIEHHYGKDKV